jgi:hypothetical protein
MDQFAGVGHSAGSNQHNTVRKAQPQGELGGGFPPVLPDLAPDGDAERGEDQEDGYGLMVTKDQDRSS